MRHVFGAQASNKKNTHLFATSDPVDATRFKARQRDLWALANFFAIQLVKQNQIAR